MIERSIISVDGPAGAGKTTFVEHLLRAEESSMQAARCYREPDLNQPRESTPRDHPELKRYRAAGAGGAAVYRFSEQDTDAFFCSNFMGDPSHVVLEGARPIDFVDLSVFVGSVPAPRRAVLRRVRRDLARERRANDTRMRKLLESPQGTAQIVGEFLGGHLALMVATHPDMLATWHQSIEAFLDGKDGRGPAAVEQWAVMEPFRGIEHAQLVVINVRGAAERRRGEQALEDVLRLRQDPQVFSDLFGKRGSRLPITAVVADLGAAADPGLKKALRRARRSLRQL